MKTSLLMLYREIIAVCSEIHTVHCVGAFAKLRKANITFVISVRPFTWNKWTQAGRILVKNIIAELFLVSKSCR